MGAPAKARFNQHIPGGVRKCVMIGSRYYHDPKQAAQKWATMASNFIAWKYQARDVERFNNRFDVTQKITWSQALTHTDAGRKAFNEWKKDLYKRAYKRSFPIFKKMLEYKGPYIDE